MSSVLVSVFEAGRIVAVKASDLKGRRPETRNTMFAGAEILRTGVHTPVRFADRGEFSYDPISELYVPVNG